jgi:hypothetical protein
VPSISPELDPVFQRGLAKDPAARFPSAKAFVGALRAALGRDTAPAEPTVAVTPPPRRSTALIWAGLAALGLLLLGGGLALAAVLGDDDPPSTTTIVSSETITLPGTTVTTEVTTTAPATTATTATTAPAGESGVELTDQSTALLNGGRWAEAEAVARQAVAELEGTGELYEAYANYNLGRALVEQDRCDEALPYLDRSEQIQGSRPEITEARARCEPDEEGD